MNDIIALKFHISLNATTWIGRIGMVVLPPIVYFITYRWCVGLQRSDRAVLEHGIETGIIKRLPHGAYVELHQPLGTPTAGVPGRSGADENEQARLGRLPRVGQFPASRSRGRGHRTVRGPPRGRAPRPHRAAGSLNSLRPNGFAALLTARPLLGKQAVRVHPVAVVMGDGRDDQLIGFGRVAQPLELISHLNCGSDKLGFYWSATSSRSESLQVCRRASSGVGNGIAPSAVRMLRTHSP